MTSLAQNGERVKKFVLCFRYILHSSMMSGGMEEGRALAFFGDVKGLAIREAAPRVFSQLQVHRPLLTQNSWDFICYLKFLLHARFW